jgi:AcrR family transcriptional regulator
MADGVKPRRYDNSRRTEQVRASKAAVVDSARRLFLERGYPGTTIEAIALESGVPQATLYRLFGSKRAVLSALLDVTYVGDDRPVALGDRPEVRALLEEADPARLLHGFAHVVRELFERVHPLLEVLTGAALVDTDAAEMLASFRRQRLEGQSRIAAALARSGALRADVSQPEAADRIYALMSPDLYRLLVHERGWEAVRYERWLADLLCATLLPPGRGRRRGASP